MEHGYKYLGFVLLFLVVLLSTISSAVALELPSSLALGGPSQERNTEFSVDFKIKNDGATPITNIDLQNTLTQLQDLEFTNVPTSLEAGEESIVKLTAKLARDFDAVDDDLVEKAFDIGIISISADGITTETIPVTAQAVNKVRVKDFDLLIDDENHNIRNGNTIDVEANKAIEFVLEVRNDFNDGPKSAEPLGLADVDMKIRFEIVVDEDDEGEIIVGRRHKTTLLAEETDELFVEAEIDRRARGTYDLVAWIEGTDDNGARHGETIEFTLSIDRKRHEIEIDDVIVSKTALKCERNFELDVKISNIGTKTEDQIMLTVVNRKLSISEKKKDIVMRDGDFGTTTFDIEVSLDAPSGTHALEVQAFFANKYITDDSFIFIDVEDCPLAVEPVEIDEPVIDSTPANDTEEVFDPIETPDKQEEPEEVREPLGTDTNPPYEDLNALLILSVIILIFVIVLSLSIGYLLGKK